MDAIELFQLLESVVEDLHGSSEVIGHTLQVKTGIPPQLLIRVVIESVKGVQQEVLPELFQQLDSEENKELISTLASLLIAGILFGVKLSEQKED